MQPMREVVKPPGQLALDERELGEEVARALSGANPAAPANLVRFSQRERGYRPEPLIDQLLHHLSLDGCLMHADSEEAVREARRREAAAFAAASRRVTAQSRRMTAQSRRTTVAAAGDAHGGGPRASVVGEPSAAAAEPSSLSSLPAGAEAEEGGARVLRNQFNFTDRAAGMGQGPPRARGTMTEAPPTTSTSASCTRWEIFDAYCEDQERQRQAEEVARLKAAAARRGGGGAAAAAALAGVLAWGSSDATGRAVAASTATGGQPPRVVRVVERMVQQNLFKDVVMDFKVGRQGGRCGAALGRRIWQATSTEQVNTNMRPLHPLAAPAVLG